MPQTCNACHSPHREELDKAIVAGQPIRAIARRFALTKDSVQRHKAHVATTIRQAASARLLVHADNLVADVRRQLRRARRIEKKATAAGDHRTALQALQVQAQQAALLVKLGGHSRSGAPVPGEEVIEDRITLYRRVSRCIGIGGELVPRVEPEALPPAPAGD